MTTIPTQNAVPSEAPRDLKFNSGKIDEFVTSLEHEYKDRFGRCHMTIEGMRWIFEQLMERFKVDINQAIIAAGYIPMDSFQLGAEITKRNEILRDETTGEYYRWDGDLPKSVPAGATPESAGGVGMGSWVGVGDASLRGDLKSSAVNSGDALIAVQQPIMGAAIRTQHDRNFDTLSLRDFGAFCNGVSDDSPAIRRLMDYLASLPHVKYRGTGPNTGGIKVITSGQISVSEPIVFRNTRNLCLDGWYVKPLPGFPRGEFLLQFPSGGQIDVTANENVSLRDVTLNCGWEASGLLLQDFTNVKSDGLYVYKFHSYGVKTENVLNSSHEFVCSNLQIGQMSWGESYPEHVTMGVGVSNGNADNIYNNIVIGYCKTKGFEVTGDEGGVKSGGGALFINNMHLYNGYLPMTIDSSHVYITNAYFDGDYIQCSARGLGITNSFFQFTGSEAGRKFIEFTSGTVGEIYIVGNKFKNRNAAASTTLTNSLTGKNIFSAVINNNSLDGVTPTRIYSSNVASQVVKPADWVDTADGIYCTVSFPAYKGRKQITVEAFNGDQTKVFNVVKLGNGDVRIYCWYVTGAGKAKPTADVTVYASNEIPPDYNIAI